MYAIWNYLEICNMFLWEQRVLQLFYIFCCSAIKTLINSIA